MNAGRPDRLDQSSGSAGDQRSRLDILFSGLAKQGLVINALALRELQQRYGRANIGYLWVIVEPLMLASVVTMIHSFVSHGAPAGDISPFTFTLTGYTIFIIFRNSFTRSDGVLHQYSSLLYHNMITPFDIMLAKSIVETIGCISALAVLQTFGVILGIAQFPARPIYLIGAIMLFSWWSFAWCLLAAAYTFHSPFLERLVHPASYFAMPLSGAFFTVSLLPAWARPYVTWNPMVPVFELARYGQFVSSPDRYTQVGFVVAANCFFTYWGLLAIRRVRRDIHVA
ncbi:ABC transporter permease [Sphingobium yanoikuyae]|uniref:ABC transporter permease n=1 Tax=Sphingobium yanoikuyae TaxID=13690 RepID=UPI00240EEDBD|nr:ABC transporter permease [Sphingobium yanoikuyae]MDG2515870.1 ABC transporter permease [Sphingobium yanoikuyae]